jgi:hypothetical protein
MTLADFPHWLGWIYIWKPVSLTQLYLIKHLARSRQMIFALLVSATAQSLPSGPYTDAMCSTYTSQKCGYSLPAGQNVFAGDKTTCVANPRLPKTTLTTDCVWKIERSVPYAPHVSMMQYYQRTFVPKCPVTTLANGVKIYYCPPTTSNPWGGCLNEFLLFRLMSLVKLQFSWW